MNMLKQMAFLAGSFVTSLSASAQFTPTKPPAAQGQQVSEPLLHEFSRQRIQHQRNVVFTLGSYALANIAVGAIAAGRERNEAHYFHRMNVYWNLVNLGFAGVGLLSSKVNPDTETLSQAVRRHETMTQTLLLNTGLDVAYVVGGAYLIERGRAHSDDRDRLRGFGKSVIVQGGFLFAFDLINYVLFKRRGDKQEDVLLGKTSEGVGLVIPLR